MKELKRYVGIHNDVNGGMTDTGKIIRDAWAFQIIPEEQTCEGWLAAGIEDLWQQVNVEWEKYGFRVANLPDEVRALVERNAVEVSREHFDRDADRLIATIRIPSRAGQEASILSCVPARSEG